jgi:hypothetical protein
MNYNNSLGLALTFTLAGLGLVAMHHCHRNLLDLTLRFAGAEPVFAGQNACFTLLLDNRSGRARYGLQLELNDRGSAVLDLEPGESCRLTLELPTRARGIARWSLQRSSTFPLGLFRAWSWIHLEPSVVVYPQPAATGRAPPPERTDTGGAQDDTQGEADFAGLRNFRPGDSPRRVAWKAYARTGELVVKQYAGTDVATHWFDWNSLAGLDVEQRLSQLCRWIVEAQGHGHATACACLRRRSAQLRHAPSAPLSQRARMFGIDSTDEPAGGCSPDRQCAPAMDMGALVCDGATLHASPLWVSALVLGGGWRFSGMRHCGACRLPCCVACSPSPR